MAETPSAVAAALQSLLALGSTAWPLWCLWEEAHGHRGCARS